MEYEIFVVLGNVGIVQDVIFVLFDFFDGVVVIVFVYEYVIDLVVIGLEVLFVVGVVDVLCVCGILVFGLGKVVVQLEGLKFFVKWVMDVVGVLIGCVVCVVIIVEVDVVFDQLGVFFVVKVDGLVVGKGVIVIFDCVEVLVYVEQYFFVGLVLIEEFFFGFEVLLFFLSDGDIVCVFSFVQDFKCVFDSDVGLNIGGMGVYFLLFWFVEQFGSEQVFVEEVICDVVFFVVCQFDVEGILFIGFFYVGLILILVGVCVIEFNVCFGDFEMQIVFF